MRNKRRHEAIDLYKQIPKPDAVVTMYLFNAGAQLGSTVALQLAVRVFKEMPNNFRKDPYLVTSAFDMFIKCKDVANAKQLFAHMSRSATSYGNLMKMHHEMHKPQKVFELYERMKQENLRADLVTFILLIDACSQMGIRSIGERFAAEIPKNFLKHPFMETALIDMWVRRSDVSFQVSTIVSVGQSRRCE